MILKSINTCIRRVREKLNYAHTPMPFGITFTSGDLSDRKRFPSRWQDLFSETFKIADRIFSEL